MYTRIKAHLAAAREGERVVAAQRVAVAGLERAARPGGVVARVEGALEVPVDVARQHVDARVGPEEQAVQSPVPISSMSAS